MSKSKTYSGEAPHQCSFCNKWLLKKNCSYYDGLHQCENCVKDKERINKLANKKNKEALDGFFDKVTI